MTTKLQPVYKLVVIRDVEKLVELIRLLTSHRREWNCKTAEGGWLVEAECVEGEQEELSFWPQQ